MKKKKLPEHYVLERNQELTGSKKRFPTRKLANGAIVIINGGCREDAAEAYDVKGRWLGLFGSVTSAENAATKGYCANFQNEVSELSTWCLWNDATCYGGATVLEANDGAQIVMITDSIYLRAIKEVDGWTVEWLSREELDQQYNVGGHFELRHTDQPFVLQ